MDDSLKVVIWHLLLVILGYVMGYSTLNIEHKKKLELTEENSIECYIITDK